MELAAIGFLSSWLAFWMSWIGFQFATQKRHVVEDAHREETSKLLCELVMKANEGNALQMQVLKQGEETIALLNAIKGNLEYRSIKN